MKDDLRGRGTDLVAIPQVLLPSRVYCQGEEVGRALVQWAIPRCCRRCCCCYRSVRYCYPVGVVRCRREVAFRMMEVHQVPAGSTSWDLVHEALENSGSNLDPLTEASGSFPKSSAHQEPSDLKIFFNLWFRYNNRKYFLQVSLPPYSPLSS